MRIPIDENYILESDKMNWNILKRSGKKEKDNWTYVAHFTKPGNAINWLADREIRLSNATTFLEAIETVKSIEKKYNDILTASIEGVS